MDNLDILGNLVVDQDNLVVVVHILVADNLEVAGTHSLVLDKVEAVDHLVVLEEAAVDLVLVEDLVAAVDLAVVVNMAVDSADTCACLVPVDMVHALVDPVVEVHGLMAVFVVVVVVVAGQPAM